MKYIIDIPEDIRVAISQMGLLRIPDEMMKKVDEAIQHGTPVDLEGLKSDMKALNCGFPYGLDYLLDCLDKRLGITIIEADKAESEEE